MTPLTFTLKTQPKFTLDVAQLTPDNLAGLNKTKIKSLKLPYGKKKVALETLFSVTGADSNNIQINRSCEKLISVGRDMSHGTINVNGDVGKILGQYMQGGFITINGNAGSWVGNNMSGGRIDINGNAGDHIGAGKPGDAFGMTDGMIKISGSAGDRVGDRMRRGMIIIQGKAGDYCGSRMHAGTIIVLDKAGRNSGVGMRRGTIILAKKPSHIPATFKSNGNLKIQFLRLLFTQLSKMGNEFSIFRKFGPEAHLFSGDLARNGKGEIMILQTINLRK
jgi:formylmethanofuran dehydrogenase subunit C